ncbi:hypothetical protein ACFR9U_20870 [Halorientalis brevis]|uniref:DNA recombination and repair protein Rad51-like C-terminal domain-containing protein n=1 Tax=Halorientalis brevis TaxID=1126241 RepID=A0ABD6CGJ5_9EURY|nr:hypothetical protein [Halorientalis brevis]
MRQLDSIPELPRLEPGLTLLRVAGEGRPLKPLQSLVIDTLLLGDGTGQAVWIDALDHARTDTLSALAPSPRLLDRVSVARGFTAYQHAALVEHLFSLCESDDRDARSVTPDSVSLVVCPAVDGLYRDDDVGEDVAEALLYRVLARLQTLARTLDVPVLVTRWEDDALSAPFETAATRTITCRQTDLGVRFEGGDHETLVYQLPGGYVQTTLAYWAEILDARTPLYERYSVGESQPITPEALEG